MNSVMYGILKMVEYKVQMINFHKYFMIFTHTYKANCVRYPNLLMVMILMWYISPCAPLSQKKSHRSTKAVFYIY